MVKMRKNIFFTGSAGTGKSVLLREIVHWCREYYPGENSVAVTASTVIAAMNIGGCTVHAWAGIGLGKGTAEFLAEKIIWRDEYMLQEAIERKKSQGIPYDIKELFERRHRVPSVGKIARC